ncbi:MAG: oligosaccharide flippase family protein [Candidatus Omnitrophica bacterium]|nr:oligosaccharide flippase family protein [Candidatus Omnitrophota bacterium]
MKNLKEIVIRGGVWNVVNKILFLSFGFIQLIILARLLSPCDFGLMSIALLIMMTFDSLTEIGFSEALIQKKGYVVEYYDIVWSISAFKGLFLFLLIFVLARPIANFFNDLTLVNIIKVVSLSIIFKGISSIGIVIFRREINFYKYFIYYSSGSIINFISSISFAFFFRNVWALVIGYVLGDFTRCIASYCLYHYKPRISIKLKQLKELFSFGIWIFLAAFFSFFIRNVDRFAISKILGIVPLGFYQIASNCSNLSFIEMSDVVYQVTFPAYSKIQDQLQTLKDSYLKSLQVASLVVIPCASAIFILAPEIIKIFLGQKWLPALIPLRVLSLLGAISVFNAPLSSMILAKRKQNIGLFFSFFQLALLLVVIYPLTKYFGIAGTSLGVFFSISSGIILAHLYFYRIFGIHFRDILFALKEILISFAILFIFLLIVKMTIGIEGILTFIMFILTGATLYIFFLKKVFKFDFSQYYI